MTTFRKGDLLKVNSDFWARLDDIQSIATYTSDSHSWRKGVVLLLVEKVEVNHEIIFFKVLSSFGVFYIRDHGCSLL